MQISFNRAIGLLASGGLLLGLAFAQDQQTPAKTPAADSSAKTQSSTGTKTSATAAKKPATAAKTAAVPLTLKTQKEKFSYALGMNVGEALHKQGVPVDSAIVLRGLRDALAGGKTLMTDDEVSAVMTAVRNDLRAKTEEKNKVLAVTNKKTGEEFLTANKSKSGVVALPSGLQYKIETQGTGQKPTASDTVVCNYRGTLVDGTEFDSSYKRGQPATFPVNGVIHGWTEALQLMPVGSKWQLFIPSDLAYGDQGRPPAIGPGSTLIFEVELVSIQAADKK